MGSNASKQAANAEQSAYARATGLEQANYEQAQGQFAPYVAAGGNALTALQKLLGIGPGTSGGATNPILQMLGIGGAGGGGTGSINPATFQASPGYQYALQQGMQGVTNQAATQGGLGGNQLKALQATGQGMANQNFNQYLSNANSAYQGLVGNVAGLAGSGQDAVGKLAGLGANVGALEGANAIGAGSAQGSGIMGSVNALTGGMNQALGNAGSTSMGNNQNMIAALMSLFGSGGGGSGGYGSMGGAA
jgi:hypothetical protein